MQTLFAAQTARETLALQHSPYEPRPCCSASSKGLRFLWDYLLEEAIDCIFHEKRGRTYRFRVSAPFAAVLVILLALHVLPRESESKVFWSIGGSTADSLTSGNPNWRQIYNSTVLINSGRGELSVVGCDEPFPRVIGRLERELMSGGDGNRLYRGKSMAWGVIAKEKGVLRVVCIDAGVPGQAVLFLIEQDGEEYARSGTPPDSGDNGGTPGFPGAVVRFFVKDLDRDVSLEISGAPASPGRVLDYYTATLASQGWSRAFDTGAATKPAADMEVFLKDGIICCVLARESGVSGETVITVLHKHTVVK